MGPVGTWQIITVHHQGSLVSEHNWMWISVGSPLGDVRVGTVQRLQQQCPSSSTPSTSVLWRKECKRPLFYGSGVSRCCCINMRLLCLKLSIGIGMFCNAQRLMCCRDIHTHPPLFVVLPLKRLLWSSIVMINSNNCLPLLKKVEWSNLNDNPYVITSSLGHQPV